MLKHLTFIENHPVFNPILQVVLEYLGKTLGDPEKMYTYAAWTTYTGCFLTADITSLINESTF